MQLTRILSVAAIILGIYILFAFFYSGGPVVSSPFEPKQSFHIGCYLNDNIVQHQLIVSKIAQLQQGSWKKLQSEHRLVTPDVIDKKGVQVARNFESFINEYKIYKTQSKVSHQLFRAVSEANSEFRKCVRTSNDNIYFDEKACINQWNQYEDCSTKLSKLKNSLNQKLAQKDKLMVQIKKLLQFGGPGPKGQKDPREDLLAEFRRKDKQLQDKQKGLQLRLKLQIEKVSSTQYNLVKAKSQRTNAFSLYIQCSTHRSQFRQCQQLTKEMLNLGHGSIEKLGQKLQRKKGQLEKVQEFFHERPSVELKTISEKYFEEYKTLFKLFIETKAKMKKHCGCTEEQQSKLFNDVQRLKREEQLKQGELEKYKQQLRLTNITYLGVKQDRKKLLEELNKILEFKPTPDPEIDTSNLKLIETLRIKISDLDIQIQNVQSQFEKLKFSCESIRNSLLLKLSSISKVNDCLNKYRYYSQLKRSLQKQGPKQVKMNQGLKRKLINSVEDFVI